MALKDLTDGEAVLRAIKEYDALGREEFLDRYGFGAARKYLLVHEGHSYDSKAIVGVAHFFQTGSLLSRAEFTGGVHGAVKRLEALGFSVVEEREELLKDQHRGSFELIWNPSRWPWPADDFRALQKVIAEGGQAAGRWSTGSRKSGIEVGDQVFLFLVGEKQKRGLIASGYATSPVFRAKHWDRNRSDKANYVRMDWEILLDPEDVLPWAAIQSAIPMFPDKFQSGGHHLGGAHTLNLECLWNQHAQQVPLRDVEQRIETGVTARYGHSLKKYRIHQQRFRALLLKHYPRRCCVCGIDRIEVLEAAHIIADSLGGPSTIGNGRIMCANHHRAHDAKLFHLDANDKPVWHGNDSEFPPLTQHPNG